MKRLETLRRQILERFDEEDYIIFDVAEFTDDVIQMVEELYGAKQE